MKFPELEPAHDPVDVHPPEIVLLFVTVAGEELGPRTSTALPEKLEIVSVKAPETTLVVVPLTLTATLPVSVAPLVKQPPNAKLLPFTTTLTVPLVVLAILFWVSVMVKE